MKALLLFVLFALPGLLQAQTSIYLLPGAKAGKGSSESPFGTLEEARNAIRALPPSAHPVAVILRDGVYLRDKTFTLSAKDGGTKTAPITYKAEHPGKAWIIGCTTPPQKAIQPVPEAIKARLTTEARQHVKAISLAACGISCPKKMPDAFRMPTILPDFFQNGKRLQLACWPNDGWTTIDKIIDSGTKRNDGSVNNAAFGAKKTTEPPRGGTFRYKGERPAHWRVEEGIYLHGFWCFDWYDQVHRVSKINPEKKEITLAVQHEYGIRQGNPSPRRWKALNVLDEIDKPGEYAIDLQKGIAYVWPHNDAPIQIARCQGGLIQLNGAQNIILEGLATGYTQGTGFTVLQSKNITIRFCLVTNAREIGMFIQNATDCTVENCDINECGKGGIWISGGDRKTLTPSGCKITNNKITGFSRHNLTYASGLHLTGVGIAAQHNFFADAPHMAIGLSGNDHLFAYNMVSNVCTSSDDAAAFYKGRNPSCRGNQLLYNYWCDIGSPRGHGNAAIYFDDGDGGDTVYGNLFVNCGDPGKGSFGTVFSHGGHDNRVQNSLFIQCKRALGSAPWSFPRWKKMLKSTLWQDRLLKEVNITNQVYTQHYPALKGYFDVTPQTVRSNWCERTIFVGCAETRCGNWKIDTDSATLSTDIFENPEKRDFRIKPEAAPRLPKKFTPLPIEKMGLCPGPRISEMATTPSVF